MKTEFLKYMLERFAKETINKKEKKHAIITISREIGCHANIIAENLAKTLKKEGSEWRIVNKEILNDAAKELKISPQLIDSISNSEKKGFFVDIAKGFSEKFYTNNKLVKNTISRVIQSFAKDGNIIFVGRGAAGVTRSIPKSLHIKLTAPLETRIESINKGRSETLEKTKAYVIDIDKKRERLIKYFSNEIDPKSLFDISFNEMTISDREIVDTIMNIVKSRRLL